MKLNIKQKIWAMSLMGAMALPLLTSCEDFLTIYPNDKTTGKDFWKNKGQVEEMVAGAYKQMSSDAIEERAIVWGMLRSDDVAQSIQYNNTTMEYIRAVNLYPDQAFCDWSAFYNVINRCNQVIKHAPEVMDLDPEFTKGDRDVAVGQMKALRSLAYFYLVRAFRDVPFVGDTAYEGDDQVDYPAQSTPYDVLTACIKDAEEAASLVMKSGEYGNWRDYGYFTQDACWALLADLYLWRASMTGDKADYQQVVDNVRKVVASKEVRYQKENRNNLVVEDDTDNPYHLYNHWEYSYREPTPLKAIFVDGNSRESILELQHYAQESNASKMICNYLVHNEDNYTYSRLMASQIYNKVQTDNANTTMAQKAFSTEDDYRFWAYLYNVNDENIGEQRIRKFATTAGELPTIKPGGNGDVSRNTANYKTFGQNWIVYRLTDLLLMEAEARTQLAVDGEDSQLNEAYELVRNVNARSLVNRSKDSLVRESYPTKEQMEQLVLSERQRELCFEGKRWFDLMRYSYRHMDGVNAKDLMTNHTSWPALDPAMVSLASRSYVTGADIFARKMTSEPFLYWPIYSKDIEVFGKVLKQNPVFQDAKTVIRN